MQSRIIFIFLMTMLQYKPMMAQNDVHINATINYELKVNNHKAAWWADSEDDNEDAWVRDLKENTPKFSTYYYSLLISNKQSVFKYTGRDEKIQKVWGDDIKEDDIWYTNFETSKCNYQKNVYGEVIRLEDSLKKINWKIIPSDEREFAGLKCKKAIGILYDSVYVFAYYTDAIAVSAGPMSIQGLPGAILGLTIPRMHISCVATSFSPQVATEQVKPPKKGKLKSYSEIYAKVKEATKDWGRWAHKGIWTTFL